MLHQGDTRATDEMCRLRPEGLTAAQTSQLTADFFADPDAFNLIVRFSGKYIDEREELLKRFNENDDTEKEVARSKTEYEHVWETFSSTSTDFGREKSELVGRAALKAAGAAMREAKDTLKAETDSIFEDANDFSGTIASFCLEKMGSKQLLLMGIEYEYDHGYIATIVPAKPIPKPIIFAGLSEVQARNREQIPLCPPEKYEISKTLVRMAFKADWLRLLHCLELVTRY